MKFLNIKILWFWGGVLLFSACQPTLMAEFQDRPVVESYLYAGEPASVTVSKLLPFRNDVRFSDEEVDELTLTITDETTGNVYPLTPQGAGVYTGHETFLPEAGHTYRLQFTYDGVPVTATTQIAALPGNVAFSKTTVTAGFGGGMGGGGDAGDSMEPLEITWDNPTGEYYIITATCTESNPTPIFDMDDNDNDDDTAPDFPLSFQTEPTQGASAQLSAQSFSYLGKHTVKLCRIQPEYVLLYQRMNSTSANLVELHANVENGFGVFTGVSSESREVNVVSR
ncbi:MAG: DUF4249 domain-containing protein [Prevotellaceae bacterium]|jgi:hypothetical protein|nr:DUF4249 domain-containing protein [Prevotellaceae bacterium]